MNCRILYDYFLQLGILASRDQDSRGDSFVSPPRSAKLSVSWSCPLFNNKWEGWCWICPTNLWVGVNRTGTCPDGTFGFLFFFIAQ